GSQATGATPRSTASLDSLVGSLDEAGFNLLAGDVQAGIVADSMHHLWDERAALRRAWRDASNLLEPTSVAWVPAVAYGRAIRSPAGAAACSFDSIFGEDRIA